MANVRKRFRVELVFNVPLVNQLAADGFFDFDDGRAWCSEGARPCCGSYETQTLRAADSPKLSGFFPKLRVRVPS